LFHVSQAKWLAAWRHIVQRYAPGGAHPQRNVVGADLRNEPRSDTLMGLTLTWRKGKVAPWLDWPRAAETAGNLVLRANPRLLVVVEGTNYATDLRGAGVRPVRLRVRHRLVYSAHDYSWDHLSPKHVSADLSASWGWLLMQHRWWTTPVLVGEYGSCHPDDSNCSETSWFAAIRQYLAVADVDWTYWSANGTGSSGVADPTTCGATPRSPGCADWYGVSDPTWAGDASPALSADLRALEPATQSP
jgi:endoglucanase